MNSVELGDKHEERAYYIIIFAGFMIISIISTCLIYYFIRHKKRSFFEASGRKYIESLGENEELICLFNNIIQNDEINKLEQHIIANSIGILNLINKDNQNLLHLCCLYGSKKCLIFLLNFKNLDPNKKDNCDKIPLNYLIENYSQENENNKDMFVHLSLKTNYDLIFNDDFYVTLHSWQRNIFENYIKQEAIKLVCS